MHKIYGVETENVRQIRKNVILQIQIKKSDGEMMDVVLHVISLYIKRLNVVQIIILRHTTKIQIIKD